MTDATGSAPRPPPPWWAPAALSWAFLTILPAPAVEASAGALGRAIALFPVVGAAIGLGLGGLGLALDRLLPPGPVAVLLLAAGVILTGGLHLDGLMDTADGVFGARSPERRLEIMRDSRVGAFGVAAGALVLLGEYASLAELSGVARLVALVAALSASRWGLALAIARFPSARPGGLGAAFQRVGARRPTILAASMLALGISIACGVVGLAGLVGTVLVVMGIGQFLANRLGGLTGDTYGALAVTAEILILYLAVAALHIPAEVVRCLVWCI